MPNTKGGKNYKKSKHVTETAVDPKKIPRASPTNPTETRKKLSLEDRNVITYPNTKYATLVKIRGGCMTEVRDIEGNTYTAVIPGSMRRRVFINPGDIILIQARTNMTHTDKYDIIYKYSAQETKYLQSIKAINFKTEEQETDNVRFANESELPESDSSDDDDESEKTDDDDESEKTDDSPSGLVVVHPPTESKQFDRDKRHTLTLDDL
jgi:initiation factor 1A